MTQLIERREKITLNWRPRGAPARRVDDFAELPFVAPEPPPPAPDPDTRDIGLRLENWARWATESKREIGASGTAKMIDRAKREAGIVEERSNERRQVDETDALLLERAMPLLETRNRMLLYWCYIRQAQPEVVCRKMSIAHRPASVFVEQFRQAQAAVQCLLDKERKQG